MQYLYDAEGARIARGTLSSAPGAYATCAPPSASGSSLTSAAGTTEKPEDWKGSSFRHYQTGMRGTVEIESEWTARERGWQLPEWMRYRQLGSSSPVPNGEGPGAPSTE